jgi:hypothetical protein
MRDGRCMDSASNHRYVGGGTAASPLARQISSFYRAHHMRLKITAESAETGCSSRIGLESDPIADIFTTNFTWPDLRT